MIPNIIFCPYAGSSKYSFQQFNTQANITVIEYPGHGKRIREELLTDIDLIVHDAFTSIKNIIATKHPYIIWGYSMGALVGYRICQEIQKHNMPQPVKLVACAKTAPSVKRSKLISHLDDLQFWSEIKAMGGISEDILSHPELMSFFLPILRADIFAVEQFEYHKTEKLNIPIDIFYGDTEDITEKDLVEWQSETTKQIHITQLHGNHFFIFKYMDFFIRYLNQKNKPGN